MDGSIGGWECSTRSVCPICTQKEIPESYSAQSDTSLSARIVALAEIKASGHLCYKILYFIGDGALHGHRRATFSANRACYGTGSANPFQKMALSER